jgi:hypothetical protein
MDKDSLRRMGPGREYHQGVDEYYDDGLDDVGVGGVVVGVGIGSSIGVEEEDDEDVQKSPFFQHDGNDKIDTLEDRKDSSQGQRGKRDSFKGRRETRKGHKESFSDSSSSYASSDYEELSRHPTGESKATETHATSSRSTDAAQRIQRQRKVIQKELNAMLNERSSLSRQIATLVSQLEGIRGGPSNSRAKRPSSDISTFEESSPHPPSKQDLDDFGRPLQKKPKLEEATPQAYSEMHKSREVKGLAKSAIKTPLMQRLLVGTLQRSQKEVEREKADKSHIMKADKERQIEEKLSAETEARKRAQISSLESSHQQLKQKLQLLSISITQKQEDLDCLLWDEHEGYIRGDWLFTKTEPRLYYKFAKSSQRVEQELAKQIDERASSTAVKVVSHGTK